MYLKKFGSGKKGKCIQIFIDKTKESGGIEKEEKWLTPIEFEAYSGKANCRDWKRTIKAGGQQLMALFDSKILLCHAVSCSCGICTNDSSQCGPVRPFVKYRRRKKDEIQAQNAYKKFLSLKPPTLPASLLEMKALNGGGAENACGDGSGATGILAINSNNKHVPLTKKQIEINSPSKFEFFQQQFSESKLPKISKLISEVAQEMASVEENTWEPLEQVNSNLSLFCFNVEDNF